MFQLSSPTCLNVACPCIGSLNTTHLSSMRFYWIQKYLTGMTSICNWLTETYNSIIGINNVSHNLWLKIKFIHRYLYRTCLPSLETHSPKPFQFNNVKNFHVLFISCWVFLLFCFSYSHGVAILIHNLVIMVPIRNFQEESDLEKVKTWSWTKYLVI